MRSALLFTAIAAVSACGDRPAPRAANDAPMTCGKPNEPDLAAWDSHARGLLASQRKSGVIVVRYEVKDGCNVELETLPNCIAELRDGFGKIARYDYSPYFASEKKVVHDKAELFSRLPLGAASFEAAVGQGQALRTDLAHVGIASLPPDAVFRSQNLHGSECARATHVVSRVYLGAFAMKAGESRDLEAATTVFGAGGGGKSTAQRSVAREEGDLNECAAAKIDGMEHAGCAVPLRLGLAPIEGASREKAKSDAELVAESACGRACAAIHEQCNSLDVLTCTQKCNSSYPDTRACQVPRDAFLDCVRKQRFRDTPDGCPSRSQLYTPAACQPAENALQTCREEERHRGD